MRALVLTAALALAVPRSARAERGEKFDPITVTLQSVGGLGGGMVGALALGVLGASIVDKSRSSGDWDAALTAGLIGAGLGSALGVTLGVQLVGDSMDGRGRWYGTAIGAAGGLVLNVALFPTLVRNTPPALAFGAVAVLMIAPTVVGYHLTADNPPVMMFPMQLSF
jgi:hypothetical protein